MLRVALVTSSHDAPVVHYARRLLPHLRELSRVDVFAAGDQAAFEGALDPRELDPGAYERIVYQLANEGPHAFMLPLVRAHGGTVVLHDWYLHEPVARAYPAWSAGGWRGVLLALREGGVAAAREYARARGAGEPPVVPVNRSVVRLADSFLVHARWMRERIVDERNAATPVGVVWDAAEELGPDLGRRVARSLLCGEADWAALARRYLEHLERFPSHRSNRKSLIRTAIEASDRMRAAARAREEGPG